MSDPVHTHSIYGSWWDAANPDDAEDIHNISMWFYSYEDAKQAFDGMVRSTNIQCLYVYTLVNDQACILHHFSRKEDS